MSANERSKPDLRVIVHVERHAGYGDGSTLTVKASVCHIDPDQYGDGALSPRFSYQPDGIGEYEGLTISGQIGSYKGAVDADDFYGRTLAFRDLYSIELNHAESNVKVLRRITKHLERLDEKFGRTDYAGMCGRLADAIAASDPQPLGIHDRNQLFANGTHYRWMNTDSLRSHLAKQIADWMEADGLHKRQDTAA